MKLNVQKELTKERLRSTLRQFRGNVDTAFNVNITIGELLEILRNRNITHDVYYFYAVDESNRLYGVIPTRDILLTDPSKRLIDIVDEDLITLYEGITIEHALKVLTEHQFLSVPIVDEEYRLVGLFEITRGDVHFHRKFKKRPIKEIQDIFQIIGFKIEKGKLATRWKEYRYRMPWLIGNLVAGFICAFIATAYQATLSKVIILSFFIPLILTLSESISMQSMTLSLQFTHQKKIYWSDLFKRLMREWSVALSLGLTSALLLIACYFLWFDKDWYPDLPMIAIAISIFISMTIAASFGTLFPLLLHHFSLDPKIAAGPVVLMATDIMTTAVYLWIATKLIL